MRTEDHYFRVSFYASSAQAKSENTQRTHPVVSHRSASGWRRVLSDEAVLNTYTHDNPVRVPIHTGCIVSSVICRTYRYVPCPFCGLASHTAERRTRKQFLACMCDV
jgi:hypothetical protein